jgi:hypothetical protein
MADLVALGLADSFIGCDPNPRFIQLKAGRVDAVGPGPSGVPGPADTLEFATNAFATAGFSQSDMIQAVACGHSIGSVHEVNFPDIVPLSVVNSTNLDGADSFDSTPAVFDNVGVTEYLTGTGKMGGPLVVGANMTTNSDLRIFSSDGNATIRALQPAQAFEDSCFAIFERMLDTVPKEVTLSDPIVVRPFILREGHLDLSSTGVVSYSGDIAGWSTATTPPSSVTYFYATSPGVSTGTKTSVSSSSKTNFLLEQRMELTLFPRPSPKTWIWEHYRILIQRC